MMMSNSKIIVCLSILAWTTFTKQLVMIQETFRHGARYPVFHQNQDHSSTTHIVENSGQLTSEGKNMHYLLGKIIYDKYWNDLFKGTPYQNSYEQTQFYVKSTDKNRTIQSAQSHLFGLLQKLPKLQLNRTNYQYSLPAWKSFNQSNNVSEVFQIFETGPAFHPTAIHVEKRGASACDQGDFLTKYDEQSCPNQKFWKSQNFNTDEYLKITRDSRVKQAISALEAQVGKNVEFEDVYRWKDTFTCMKYLGYPRLKVFDDPKYSGILNFIQVYTTYLAHYAQKDQISAVSTDYFKRTLKNFDSKAKQTFTPRVVIYSGHDTTIAMVFAAMKFVTVQCLIDHYLNSVNNDDTCIWEYPPFTANIIFQLWNNNGEYSIRFLYNGEVRKIPVCGWKIQCTLTEFREWVNTQLAVDNVASACGYVGSERVFYAVIFLMASALVLLIAYIVYLHAKIKKIDSIGRAKKQGYIQNFEEKQMEEKPQQGFEVQGRTKY